MRSSAAYLHIADAPRTLRVQIWCLYLTILDAIMQLGPEEGKKVFGRQLWRHLAAKVRNSDIWEDVVKIGYRDVQADLDVRLVVNL